MDMHHLPASLLAAYVSLYAKFCGRFRVPPCRGVAQAARHPSCGSTPLTMPPANRLRNHQNSSHTPDVSAKHTRRPSLSEDEQERKGALSAGLVQWVAPSQRW